MPCSELQLLHCICIYVFHPCLCLFHTIGNVHSCRMAKNESSLFSSSLSSNDTKSFVLCCLSRFNHSRSLFYIPCKYYQKKNSKFWPCRQGACSSPFFEKFPLFPYSRKSSPFSPFLITIKMFF